MGNAFDDFDDVPKPQLVFGGKKEEEKEETIEQSAETAEGETSEAGKAAEEAIAAAETVVKDAEAVSQSIAEKHSETAEKVRQTAAAAAAAAAAVSDEPKTEEKAEAAPEETAEGGLSDSMLTEEERVYVDEFSKTIDVRDTEAVLSYGAAAQKKMADFSERALQNVKTKDLGEVGDMLAGLVTELKSFDADEEEKKGLFGLFKKTADKATTMKAKYEKTSVNVEKIVQALEAHQVQLIKDIAVLDKMYELNLSYFKELTMYILAGKKRLKEVREGELAELRAKAERTGLAEDAQAAKDLDEMCERFEKKLYDLELTRTIALQTAPQIRLIQDSDEVMVQKIQSTLVNTIPLWKNQMVIALGIQHSTEAAAAQHAVTQVTNELLKKNAEKLKQATIETAKEAERGIVDMETLKTTNATLISTLDEVLKIQSEGKTKRAQAEAEMAKMEEELKRKLLRMASD
ncbi:MAG: toxic anion resistance protein [Lachnospiraceae bacterium]|nr:toxic anion resistance protein [Lachnospiraceae bacterium]